MSEPKLISPMLDSFEMGGPISDHNGVRCCPAMRKNSDDKYIVKIISIPESQTKLDALLLTGAFSDSQAALSYFEELASGIVDEKKILDNLSQLEGFIPFEDCQIVPMDDAVGYDVYLLSEYKKTLERLTAKKAMTQLSAVNLGLDLCAALSACRRSGYLFVDLKPSNIYITGDNEYKIGDLGFVRLGSLKYESLPDKYRSSYTAPELEDIIAPLNDTIDIYALGLVLYQVFNGGTLPFEGQQAPATKFDPPKFADDEMAEIILKACDPDPANRWQDPVQMGQAIVAYMQKNGVNDTPLTAENFGPNDEDTDTESVEVPGTDLASDEAETDLIDAIDAIIGETVVNDTVEEISDEEVDAETETEKNTEIAETGDEESCEPVEEDIIESVEEPVSDAADDEVLPENVKAEEADETDDTVEETIAEEQTTTEIVSDAMIADQDTIEETTEAVEETVDDVVSDVEEYINLSFLDDLESTVQDGEVADESNISDDIADILEQIDELAAHDVPAPVVAPEPITITIPDPVLAEDDVVVKVEDAANESSETADDSDTEEDIDVVAEEEMPYVPKKKRTGLIWGIIIAIALALAAGGYYFYSFYYLQPIHAITLDGSEDSLQVVLNTDAEESLLTVVCADSHGNKVSAPVVGGKAAFSGLTADTAYTVSVEIDGFHKLTGTTSKVYSTPVQTKMMQINAITGSESGSVNLSFAVDGPDSEKWNVIYNAEGEAERVVEFSGHSATLTGLTVGKEYTFKLEPVTDIYLSGETEISYVARALVCAENLHISSFLDGALIAQWEVPSDTIVTQWTVRCYNDAGYSETISTDTNTATFENLDESLAYTIEVTAADMSVFQRVSVGANTITISDFIADTTETGMLNLSWNSNRSVPADGWAVEYSVDDIKASEPVIVTENFVKLPGVPHGYYAFNVTDNTGNTVLGGSFEYAYEEVSDFDAYAITKSDITPRLCKTPDHSDWNYQDLEDEDYVNSFAANDKISVVLACDGKVDESDDEILIAYCVYSEDDTLVTYAHTTQRWDAMWNKDYCELDIPVTPKEAGTYNVIIYFNGAEVGSQKFEMTA